MIIRRSVRRRRTQIRRKRRRSAIYHAAKVYFRRVDGAQESLLTDLVISREEAFIDHNLAPLELRRDIAVFGSLFKVAHGEANP